MSEERAVWLKMTMVPPPDEAPVEQFAETLDLVDGLRAEKNQRQFCCSNCSKMQPPGWMVWVPDGVRCSDPDWSVTESCRQSAFNGDSSGWCLKCAKMLGRSKSRRDTEGAIQEIKVVPFLAAKPSWWKRILS